MPTAIRYNIVTGDDGITRLVPVYAADSGGSGTIPALTDLTDVDITSKNDGQHVVWSEAGQAWVVVDAPTAPALTDLIDVDITAKNDGQMVVWSDADQAWVVVNQPTGGGSEWTEIYALDNTASSGYVLTPMTDMDISAYTTIKIEMQLTPYNGDFTNTVTPPGIRFNTNTTSGYDYSSWTNYSGDSDYLGSNKMLLSGSSGQTAILHVEAYVYKHAMRTQVKSEAVAGVTAGKARFSKIVGLFPTDGGGGVTNMRFIGNDNAEIALGPRSWLRVYGK